MQANSLDEAKRRILSRTSLEALIGEQVSLLRRGARLTGLCPFHAEKSPSFYVFDDHYHCFGCHAHGDAISFVRQTKELGFVESLRYLASKYGIEAPELEENTKYQNRRNEQAVLSQIMVTAQEFFQSGLHSSHGDQAREYLKQRGFSDENISSFGFGLTPPEHYGLVKALRNQRYRDEDILKVGLGSVSAKSGQLYDFFRERLTIPIRDPSGRVIAFGGRTTNNDPAKYKNSAATPLFDKSGVLFGLDYAKEFIKSKGRAILVEGYMDTLCLWQEGFGETVACMGTALSVRQLKLLQNQAKCSEVILLFDGDRAGNNATFEAIEVALAVPGLRVRAAILGGGEDPDTFVRKFGAQALEDLLAKANDLIEVVIFKQLEGASVASIPTIVSEKFVPWLLQIQDPMKKSFMVNLVASRTGVSKEILERQLRSFLIHGDSRPRAQAVKEVAVETVQDVMPTRSLTPIEESFLGNLFHSDVGEFDLALANDFVNRNLNLEPLWENFAKAILSSFSEGQSASSNIHNILSTFTPEEAVVLDKIVSTQKSSFSCTNRNEQIKKLIAEHKKNSIQRSISAMKQQVSLAGVQTPEMVPELLQQIMALHKALSEVRA